MRPILLPGVIWITGVTASGKTTLGKALCAKLRENEFQNISFLDGEELRTKLDRHYGYSVEERFAVAENIIRVALEQMKMNNLVVVATITHKIKMRQMARELLQPFVEVYLQCPIKICAARDYKGHYQHAFAGDYNLFVGVTEPYEVSSHPELVLQTDCMTVEQSVKILFQTTLERFQNRGIVRESF